MKIRIEIDDNLTEEERAFVQHEIELLEKKSGSKGQTKTQKENAILKSQLVFALADLQEEKGRAVTIAEFKLESKSELASLSTSKPRTSYSIFILVSPIYFITILPQLFRINNNVCRKKSTATISIPRCSPCLDDPRKDSVNFALEWADCI